MRAAQIKKYGGKDVLRATTKARKPSIQPDQVLVEVHAAGVNPFDWKVREGLTQEMAKLKFPATLGGDFSGVVIEVGKDVTEFNVGDEVYGQANALSGNGSYAEFTPAKDESTAIKPKSVDFAQTAALPLAGVSAYQALVDHANLQAGQKVLIHGGAGGIGSFAIPLAKHIGAYVASTAATENIDYVKSLGADKVIDYKTEDFATMLQGFDVVYDTIGGETFKKSFEILRPNGILVTMITPPDESFTKRYHVRVIVQFTHVTAERLDALSKLVDADIIRPKIDKVFPLEQASEALDYIHSGNHQGKVVLKIQD